MRVVGLVAVSLLVAGCSQAISGHPAPTGTTPTPPRTSATTPSTTRTPPAAGARVSDVIAWVEAGNPADAADYHTATRDGVTTELGDDVAFTTPPGPAGRTSCMTDTKHAGGALACLVDLADPPPRPKTVYGEWKGNWVDFDGAGLQVGSVHGDPGRFDNGDGSQLAYGEALSFGEYRCRADQAGLYCVNYAHRSAARFSAAGIEPFGCLQPVPAPADVGEKFVC